MMSAPPIGPLQGKFWGTTRCVFYNGNTDIWEINVKKGGFCSEHFHDYKWNRFVVTKGRLKVTIFFDDEENEISPKRVHVTETLEADLL